MDTTATDTVKGDSAESQEARAHVDYGVRRDAMYMAIDYHLKRADINAVNATNVTETATTFEGYLTGGSA